MNRHWGPNSIIGATHWWLEHVSLGLAAERGLRKDQFLRIRYEDLVLDPEQWLKKICNWLNLEFYPEMIKGGGFKAPLMTVMDQPQILREPDPQFAYAWEKKLTPRQIEIFESQTMDMLSYLGYPIKFGLRAKKPGISSIGGAIITEILMGLYNRIRFGIQIYKASYKIKKDL
jgi:hypothetical protein